MAFKIESSTPGIAKKANNRSNYPFEELEQGESFYIDIKHVNEASLRVAASRKNVKYDGEKCFRVLKGVNEKTGVVQFEVARTV